MFFRVEVVRGATVLIFIDDCPSPVSESHLMGGTKLGAYQNSARNFSEAFTGIGTSPFINRVFSRALRVEIMADYRRIPLLSID